MIQSRDVPDFFGAAAEFLRDEAVVVEVLVRQVETRRWRRPRSSRTSRRHAALGAGLGASRHVLAADGAGKRLAGFFGHRAGAWRARDALGSRKSCAVAADREIVSNESSMKTLPLVLALSAFCATSALAQKPEPQKPTPKKTATPATPAEAPVNGVKNVTPDEVEKLLQTNKDIVVLDVRTPEEYEMGHIAGAKNISFLDADFETHLKEVAGKPIVLHCAAGTRSTQALELLKTKGFPAIYHMDGGYKAWIAAGKPVVK